MIERWWKRRHYSKPGPRHHPTRLKEAVTSGYGEPKQARCRKRRIQPRGHLRTDRGFLYSETACLKYQVAFARFPGRKAASRFMFTAEETCPFCRIFLEAGKVFVDHSWFGRAGWFHPDTPQSSLFTVAIHREDGGMERDQFTTTFNSGAVPGPPPAIVSSRKRFPSVVTSYSNTASFTASLGAWAKCVSNSGCGVPGSKAGLVNGPEGTPALTATATILPSAPT